MRGDDVFGSAPADGLLGCGVVAGLARRGIVPLGRAFGGTSGHGLATSELRDGALHCGRTFS